MKNIAILGSTGSIGKNTIEVIESLQRNGCDVEIKLLSANSNVSLLIEQVNKLKPKAAVIYDESKYGELKEKTKNTGTEILSGQTGLIEIIRRGEYDLAVNAMVGFSGLLPTIEIIKQSKNIALANKESLVVAGGLIYKLLENSNSKLLPIDSEHSAILQCIQGESIKDITKIILTASGGPFRCLDKTQMKNVTLEQALNHPNWKMGNKITIDSATLMNKGFEIIEAKWLFGIEIDKIDVMIHPQSIIHSMVEFSDGSVKAQLGVPDMKIPIQYAITFPQRVQSDFPRLDFRKMKSLTFEEPDFDKFDCLKLAYDVIKMGGSYPVVLNAANEVAVDLFLNEKIDFTGIPDLIRKSLDRHNNHNELNIENIFEIDGWTRKFVRENAGFR
ncbi:MAG: 1-deoxy-D-xylulose-5-phosphate reductoisomerase [Saprospiraceae bacterium]